MRAATVVAAVVLGLLWTGSAGAAERSCSGDVVAASELAVVLQAGTTYEACLRATGRRTSLAPPAPTDDLRAEGVIGRFVPYATGNGGGGTSWVLDARTGKAVTIGSQGLGRERYEDHLLLDGRTVVVTGGVPRGSPGGTSTVRVGRPGRTPREIETGGINDFQDLAVSPVHYRVGGGPPVTRIYWTGAEGVRSRIIPNSARTDDLAGGLPLPESFDVVATGRRCAGRVVVATGPVRVLARRHRAVLCHRPSGRRTQLGRLDGVSHVELRGPRVLFERSAPGAHADLVRADAATGEVEALQRSARGSVVGEAELLADGTVVYSFATDFPSGGDPDDQIVAVAPDGTESDVTPPSDAIEGDTLAVEDGRAYWMQAGVPRSALLRARTLRQAEPTGSITGRLTDRETGAPVAGACVFVERVGASGERLIPAKSGEDGTYALTGLATGTYRVNVRPFSPLYSDLILPEDCFSSANYQSTWWRDAPDSSAATPVSVTDGVATSGVDQPLRRLASISGRVVDTSGEPLARQCVTLGGQRRYTGSDGRFTFHQLQPGAHEVEAAVRGTYFAAPVQFRCAVTHATRTASFTVAEGESRTVDDLVLERARYTARGLSVKANCRGKRCVIAGRLRPDPALRDVPLGEVCTGRVTVRLGSGRRVRTTLTDACTYRVVTRVKRARDARRARARYAGDTYHRPIRSG